MIDKIFKIVIILAIVLYFGAPVCVGFLAGYENAVLEKNVEKGG